MNKEILNLIKSKTIRDILMKNSHEISLVDQAALVLKYVKSKKKSKRLIEDIRNQTNDVDVLSEIDSLTQFEAENKFLTFPNFFEDGDLVKYWKYGQLKYAVVIGSQQSYTKESVAYVVEISDFMHNAIENSEQFSSVMTKFHDHVEFERLNVVNTKKELVLPNIMKNYVCFGYCYRMYKNEK